MRWRRSRLGRITDALELDLLLTRIGPLSGLRILDAGCGDGVLAVELSRRGADVTGMDRSDDMIAAAKARAEAENVFPHFEHGEAAALPFADGTFDIVTAVTVLCFVKDADQAVREMTRVLKPGGRLVLGDLSATSLWAIIRRIRGWLGSVTWRKAFFRTPSELVELAQHEGLAEIKICGAIFYPPIGAVACLLQDIDGWIGQRAIHGAAFLVLTARKRPQQSDPDA